jgi:hypothetical protein
MVARSSGPTGARGPPPGPPSVAAALRARKSPQASTPDGASPGQKDTTGTRARNSAILASMSGAPTRSSRASLAARISSSSAGGLVGWSGTLTAPARPTATSTVR